MNNQDHTNLQRKSSVRKVFLVHMSQVVGRLRELDLSKADKICLEMAGVVGQAEEYKGKSGIKIRAGHPNGIFFSEDTEFYVTYMPGILLRRVLYNTNELVEILTPKGKDIKKWDNVKNTALRSLHVRAYTQYRWIPRDVILDQIELLYTIVVINYAELAATEDYDREEAKAWVKYWLSRLEIPIDAIVNHNKFRKQMKVSPKETNNRLTSAIYTNWPEIAE